MVKIQKNDIYNIEDKNYDLEKLCKKTERYLGYPMFIKPAREGSSFGVNRDQNRDCLLYTSRCV